MRTLIRLLSLGCASLLLALAPTAGCRLHPKESMESTGTADRPARVTSPDQRVTVEFHLTADGAPRYTVRLDGRTVIEESRLGLVRNDADFTSHLRLVSASRVERVRDSYEILTAKRRHNTYVANRRVYRLETTNGALMDIVFQVSNDGAAFRYVFPQTNASVHRISEEVSSFRFPAGTRAWLQPMAVAGTGFAGTNPSYEEYYQMDIPTGTPSTFGAGWVFPALFCTGNTWILLSETALDRNYCGSRLRSESPGGEYQIGFPDPREVFPGGPVNPESSLPWLTPWRLIVVGSLATIVESTLGIDLATPPPKSVGADINPGKASWSWPLLGDGQTTYDVQKRFIDYAADMRWEYCLIDALWDKQIGYERLKELVDYGRSRNVRILVWYNSAGSWNTSPQTPRNLLLTRESRLAEFQRLKELGVAGLKIDFFGGDGQSMIAYYHDIMEDAAPFGFHLNFHGATLPRGWHRTYPHLMTVEAVRGLEFITFDQRNANRAPAHCTMLPFTRNVFDPMDFTPMVLDRIQRVQRRTTSAFELALAVLFTSGIQHYAEIPSGMAKAPDYVRDFLRTVPDIWDDVRFIDGYPGRFVVLARKGGGRWYVSGINGEPSEKQWLLDLSKLPVRGTGTLITDGPDGNLSFHRETVRLSNDRKLPITVKPNGGFVIQFD